jgi:hypothetical protein
LAATPKSTVQTSPGSGLAFIHFVQHGCTPLGRREDLVFRTIGQERERHHAAFYQLLEHEVHQHSAICANFIRNALGLGKQFIIDAASEKLSHVPTVPAAQEDVKSDAHLMIRKLNEPLPFGYSNVAVLAESTIRNPH